MRRIVLISLLTLGCWFTAAAQRPDLPKKPDAPPVVTKQMLEQRLADLKAGKEQAVANVNAFEGAIQECQHWIDLLDAAKQPAPALPLTPEPKK